MGYRTVVVIENDVLGSREAFIKNAGELYDTIISNGRSTCHVGRVIEQVHNDNVTLCIHGGGSGRDAVTLG